jgi:branched-chain amino acid transport system permease protein
MEDLIQLLVNILRPIGITESVLQFMLVNGILGVSIYLTLYTGMFSLANAGFMAIGAYAGVAATQFLGLPLWLGLLIGMAVAGAISLPIGLPVLRLKDIYLAIATIGFGEVVIILLLNFDEIISSIATLLEGERVRIRLLEGGRGIKGIPKSTETWMLFAFLFLLMFLLWRLRRSRFGRSMAAIREDERAAANMGINVVYVKNVVFILSAMVAASAGVFSAHLTRIISPNAYGFDKAVDILSFAVVGGTSTWVGPIVGGLAMGALPEVLRFLNEYRGVFIGLILLGVILFLPGGLVNPSGLRLFLRRLRRWLRRHADADGGQHAAP